MSRAPSTRRLLVTTTAGGIVFGAIMAGWISIHEGGLPVWVAALTGSVAAMTFGGSMFAFFYFGFVRPRRLDPGPPGFAGRRVGVSERMWGDGRPLPPWVRHLMYVSASVSLVMAGLNVGLMVVSGTVRPGQIAPALMFVGFAVLAVVVARRGTRARPPYSTWVAGRS